MTTFCTLEIGEKNTKKELRKKLKVLYEKLNDTPNEMIKVQIKDLQVDTLSDFYIKNEENQINWYIEQDGMLSNQKTYIKISNPLKYTGRQFSLKLQERDKKNFDEATLYFISSLTSDFKKLQELIDKDMVYCPTKVAIENKSTVPWEDSITTTIKMWNPKIDPENHYRVIKGHMQSKKTWAMISMSMYYLLKYRMTTFIIVQNSLDAVTQLRERFKNTYKRYEDYMDEEKIRNKFDILFPILDCNRSRITNKTNLEKAMNGIKPRVYIVLRNLLDLNYINNIIETVVTRRYIIMIDESDFNDSNTNAPVQEALNIFKSNASIVYDVTATPITSLMKETVNKKNIIHISKPDGYKSILDFYVFHLPKPAEYCSKLIDNPFEKDENLSDYIKDFANTEPYICNTFWGQQTLPRYSLVRIGAAIVPQFIAAAHVYKYYYDKILTITYNGSTYGISARGKALPKEPIVYDSMKSKYENGIHKFSKGVHIGHFISYLQENGGVEKYPRIMVFAGRMADRGITFASSNYAKCIANKICPWHLTEMYFIAASSMNQSNMLQASGRLCGVFPDNIPLTIYTNAGFDIYRSYGLQEELITRITNNNIDIVKEIIPEEPIAKEKTCKRKITAPKVPCKLNVVSDDLIHGGLDWNVEGFNCDRNIAELGTGNRVLVPKATITEEERERLRENVRCEAVLASIEIEIEEYERLVKLFPRWKSSCNSKKPTKIAQFISSLDPLKEYTGIEIKQLTERFGIRLSDCHPTSAKQRVKYGNIIQFTNNVYKLQPSLVKIHQKTFSI